MTNEYKRMAVSCRRIRFEFAKVLGLLWIIERLPGLRIKEPYKKMYNRSKQKENEQ